MYLLRTSIPISKVKNTAAKTLADRLLVKSQTKEKKGHEHFFFFFWCKINRFLMQHLYHIYIPEVNAKGMINVPRSVHPPLIPQTI